MSHTIRTIPPVFSAETWKQQNLLGQKLAEARKRANLSQKTLSERLTDYEVAVSPGAISKWEKGDALPNPYQLLAVCCILKIRDILGFFTETDPVFSDSTQPLSQEGQQLLLRIRDALVASGQYTPQRSRRSILREHTEMREMSVGLLRVSAGTGNFLSEDQFETMSFPVSSIPEGADFGLRIGGDSMLPYYTDGQIVWVEKRNTLNPGEVGIFVYDDRGYIKQLDVTAPSSEASDYPEIRLISFNPAYDPIVINPNLSFEIIGRVLN